MSAPRAVAGRRRWLPTLAVVAVIGHLLALYLPGSDLLPTGPPGLDKVVHVALFAVPTALLIWWTGRRRLVVCAFAVHAVVSELVQGYVIPNRSLEALDMLADVVGIGLAWSVTGRSRSPAA
ncbi:MAG: VanZ family protein [Micropruina sp.]|nr:VanZ family protein [Micropruina sp.]